MSNLREKIGYIIADLDCPVVKNYCANKKPCTFCKTDKILSAARERVKDWKHSACKKFCVVGLDCTKEQCKLFNVYSDLLRELGEEQK